jgi:hypothetical protein
MEPVYAQVRTKDGALTDQIARPYINTTDLTNKKQLLLFINSRGRHLPLVFTMLEQPFIGGDQVQVDGGECR